MMGGKQICLSKKDLKVPIKLDNAAKRIKYCLGFPNGKTEKELFQESDIFRGRRRRK